MHRRALLRTAAAIGVVGAAGCAGGGAGSPDDEPRDTTQPNTPTPRAPAPSDTDTPPDSSPSATPTGPPTSFAVISAQCGEQVNRADVSVAAGTVSVEGSTWGNDACHRARLKSATANGGTLTVRVVTVRTGGEAGTEPTACAQCITEIQYRATVEVTETPDEVVVLHDGETVATAHP